MIPPNYVHLHGAVRLLGSMRDADETVRKVFTVQLEGEPPVYGEWKPIWHVNNIDFDVQVLSVGYHSEQTLGRKDPSLRRSYQPERARLLKESLNHAFQNKEIRESVPPFTSSKAHFTGVISFSTEWLVQQR